MPKSNVGLNFERLTLRWIGTVRRWVGCGVYSNIVVYPVRSRFTFWFVCLWDCCNNDWDFEVSLCAGRLGGATPQTTPVRYISLTVPTVGSAKFVQASGWSFFKT